MQPHAARTIRRKRPQQATALGRQRTGLAKLPSSGSAGIWFILSESLLVFVNAISQRRSAFISNLIQFCNEGAGVSTGPAVRLR